MNTLTRTKRAAAASVLVAACALAACGDDDDESAAPVEAADVADDEAAADTTTADTTAAPTPDTSTDATDGDAKAEPEVVEVAMTDYAFGGIPESVPAGTKFHIQNASKKEVHELVAFRLPDDEKRPVADLMKLPEAELGPIFGSGMPAMVLLAPPGGEQIAAVGDGTLTKPGRYLLMCSIPTGADAEEFMKAAAKSSEGPPAVKGGPPHFVHGMHAEVLVK